MLQKNYVPNLEKLVKLFSVLAFIAIVIQVASHSTRYQWDFRVYYYAAQAYRMGLNPYDPAVLAQVAQGPVQLPFVYPPITLPFFQIFAILDFNIAPYLYLAFKCLLLIGLVYLWEKKFLRTEAGPLFYLFCLAAFNGAIGTDITTGNVAILEQLLMWIAFYYFLDHKLLHCGVFIILAALFKFTPALFLLLLCFSGRKRRIAYFFGMSLAFAALLVISYLATPSLFKESIRIASMLDERGYVNPSTLALLKDLSRLLSERMGISVSSGVPLGLYVCLVMGILFLTWRAYVKLRTLESRDSSRLTLFLACLTFALVMPRFKSYSYILLVVPAYFAVKRLDYAQGLALFIAALLPARGPTTPPGFQFILVSLLGYYPLLVAYGIWGVYLYKIESFAVQERTWSLFDRRPPQPAGALD